MSQADTARLREWFKPLGLVKRADRLVETARIIVRNFGGGVPDTLEQLKDLPGLGEYSARAVLCLAYDIRVPMIDEGSGRVLRRVLNLHSKRPAYSDRKLIAIAEKLLPTKYAKNFNLGLIDVAAFYCHSKNPECSPCPLLILCSYGQRKVKVSHKPDLVQSNGVHLKVKQNMHILVNLFDLSNPPQFTLHVLTTPSIRVRFTTVDEYSNPNISQKP